MNDLISRQAAIDTLVRDCKGSDEGMLNMYDIICDLKELPSAQPKILACGEGELSVPDTNVGDMISRQTVLRCLIDISYNQCKTQGEADVIDTAKTMVSVMPSAQLEPNCSEFPNNSDTISRQAAIDTEGLDEQIRCEMCRNPMHTDRGCDGNCKYDGKLYERIMQILDERIKPLSSAQPEQRYTEEELMVFRHGISLSLLSKRSAQHWRYDEDTATEIKFLERLYEKVVADMRGEQDGRFNQQTGGD